MILTITINLFTPVDKDLLQNGIHNAPHKRAVVSPHSLNPLAVHLVVDVGFGEVETRVTLLVDQKVGEVHLKHNCGRKNFKFECHTVHKLMEILLDKFKYYLVSLDILYSLEV